MKPLNKKIVINTKDVETAMFKCDYNYGTVK